MLNVDPDGILIGNGSDDILTILTRAFVPEGGLICSPTPELHPVQEPRGDSGRAIRGGAVHGRLDPARILCRTRGYCVPSESELPHRTLSSRAYQSELLQALEQKPLVLDEAYVDFTEWRTGLQLAGRKDNLIVTRTMSKSYALAGIRFGFAVADPAVVRELVKVKDSYNCDVLSLAAATAAIEDQHYFHDVRAKIIATRERMTVALSALGFEVTPSHANFVWCRRFRSPAEADLRGAQGAEDSGPLHALRDRPGGFARRVLRRPPHLRGHRQRDRHAARGMRDIL